MTQENHEELNAFAELLNTYVRNRAKVSRYVSDNDFVATLLYLWKKTVCSRCYTKHHHGIPYRHTHDTTPPREGLDYHLRYKYPLGKSVTVI